MELEKLIKNISIEPMSLPFIDVDNICTQSSDVNNGSLFVAIKGFATDGHNYIQQAIDNGASVIITDKKNSETVSSIPNIKVENSRSVLSKLASTFIIILQKN